MRHAVFQPSCAEWHPAKVTSVQDGEQVGIAQSCNFWVQGALTRERCSMLSDHMHVRDSCSRSCGANYIHQFVIQ